MAHAQISKAYSANTGTANTFSYSGSFDTFKASEVVVLLDNAALTFTSSSINDSASPREYTVDTTAKTIHIGGGNLSSGTVIIKPITDLGDPTARSTFTPGSSIKSDDLNNNQKQLLRKSMEIMEQKLDTTGGTLTGSLTMDEDTTIIFEGATADAYETTLTVTDPTADRTITLPNVTGTVVTTGDTATVTATMMAADAVDSDEIVDGSIDTVHIADSQITAAKIASNAVTTAKINTDAITGAKIADDQIDSEHLAAGCIDNEHIADGAIDSAAFDAATIVTNSEQSGYSVNDTSFFTTSAAEARYFNQSTSETIKDGDSFPDNDTTIATTAAINDRIIDLVDDVGGFVPIANELAFPNANPDVNDGTGTLVSIKALSTNYTSNGSGVISVSNGTVGNSTVTITGAENSTTYSSGFGMIVETTTTLNTYTFHRLVPKATEVTTVAGSITNINTVATNLATVNDFADKYRIASSAPGSDNDDGDLYYNTTDDKLYIYDGSSWTVATTLDGSGGTITGDTRFNDSVKAKFGTGSDLEIYHDGSNSRINDAGTGNLQLQTGGSTKFEVTSAGATVTGTLTADLADDSIDSEHYTDDSIDTAHIGDDQVTYAKIQNVSTTDRVLGRDSSGAGVIEEITPANLRTMINVEDGADVTDATNVNSAGAIMHSDLGTKGQIVVGDGSGDATILGVGSNNHILTADSSEASGVKWAAATGGTPTDITVADESTDTTCFPLFVTAATGDLEPKSGSNLTFNSSTGALGATKFIGEASDVADDIIDSEHYVDGSIDNAHIADDAIDSEHYTDGSIDHVHLAADCVDGDNIQDDVINSEHYAAASIDHEHLADDCVDGDNLADNACDSEHYTDGSIDHVHLAGDCVDGDNLADNACDSEHYTDGSIDNAHIADDAIDSEHYAAASIDHEHLADDCVDGDNIADNSIDSEHYNDGSIDNAHIADDAIDSEHYAAGSIDNEHLADNAVGTDEIADDAVTADKLANSINTEIAANTAKVSLTDNSVTLAKMAGGTDGQIITYDASGDPVAVGPGTDGQVLTSTGAGSPPAFEDAAGGGKILQVVQGSTTTEASSTSTSMADTGLSASITPATNSDVLVTVNQVMRQYRDRASTNNQGIGVNVLRGTTVVMESKQNDGNNYNDFHTAGDGANNETWRHTISFVDTNPGGDGSTALTYKTQFSLMFTDDSGQAWAQPSWEGQNQAPTSYITLMEISGGVT